VEISVPPGKTVEISDALNEYKNNEPPGVVRKRIRSYSRTYHQSEPKTADDEKATIITYDAL